MADEAFAPPTPDRPSWWLLALLSALPLALHVAAAQSRDYGYFIDEFYYVACSKRLAFGYVDHPPLAPWLLAAIRAVAGDGVMAIRLAPFLAMSGTVWVTGLLVGRFGGGRFATALACLAVGFSPVLLAMSGFYSMNAFEPLLWLLTVLLLVRIAQTGESRLWLAVGVLTGVSFETKHTVVAYLVPLAAGIVLTRMRRVLLDRWLWAGAGIAVTLAVPNLAWQAANGWPSLEFYRNAHLLKNVPMPPGESLAAQVIVNNPLAAPVWLLGFAVLLLGERARPLRFLGLAFLILLGLHVASQTSRPDRIAAAFPLLFAAGSVQIEGLLRKAAERHAWAAGFARASILAAVAAGAAALAPIVLPLVPPARLAQYVAGLGLTAQAERGKSSPIPQLLADRTGWESFVDDVARVYWNLPEADRERAVFYAPSYGQAGALELLGPARGLPGRVIGSQNTYWHWSVGRTDSEVLVAVDADPDDLRELFAEVWEAGRSRCTYCMSWRDDNPIYVGRRSTQPVSSIWARTRHYE
jgi:4-amino-4-deoxy-L-arabinose transferase-like glycosyltransferase